MSPHPLSVLAAGLLTFASPCILPLAPVYLGLAVPEHRCPATVRELLAEQRRWLSAPDRRVAMRRDPA